MWRVAVCRHGDTIQVLRPLLIMGCAVCIVDKHSVPVKCGERNNFVHWLRLLHGHACVIEQVCLLSRKDSSFD
jgi:hypothetical protein